MRCEGGEIVDRARKVIPITLRRDARPPAFGDLLRRFRVAAGWTQEELAERAGVSARSITNYESGATPRPQRETMRLLADALALSAEDRALLAATVRAQQTQRVAPAPHALSAHLPAPLTPLLGRERELASLTALLTRDDVRLATVIGPGGVGKTRLALAFALAAAARDAYADGVYFVSLAPVREPEVLLLAMAQVLGVTPTGTQTPYDALCARLRDRHVLLVLDNFEHLLSEAVVVANLLMACAGVEVLATSRAPLRLRGEHEYLLAPLAMPVGERGADAVAESPAVQVFAHYVRAVQPEFRVTAENAAMVAAICAHLEGLPLALELAAARMKWFTPEQLLARLTPRLAVLADGPRDLAPRQRTMWDTIAWSDGLLAEEERRVFARFAVFAGGAMTDAIEAVCGVGAEVHAESLAQQNLLTLMPGAGSTPRFGMLETVREYAWGQAQHGGVAADVQRRHAAYFLELAAAAYPRLQGPERGRWLQRMIAELDNFRAALRWAREAGDAATSLRLTHALTPFWRDQGYLREGSEWAQAALEASEAAGPDVVPLRAAALVSAGNLNLQMADYERAVALADEGMTLARARGDEGTIADALSLLGIVAINRGDAARARVYLEECLALFRRLGRSSSVARVLHILANGAFLVGDYPRALALAEESRSLADQLGEELNAATERIMLARILNAMGEAERALPHAREATAIQRRAGDVWGVPSTLCIHGDILQALHRHTEAIALYDEGIAIAREIGAARDEFWGVMARAESLSALRDYPAAAAAFARGFAVARQLASKQPFALGLAAVAILAFTMGRHREAARLLSAAITLQKTMGIPQRPEGRAALDTARRALGDEEFAAECAAGEAMPLDDAVAEAVAFLDTVAHDPATATLQRGSPQ